MSRENTLRTALRLEYFTVGWNIVEGIVAVTAALSAASVALLGFGIDSFVESLSGSILIWRLIAERSSMDREHIEKLDEKAHRFVAISLGLLALYITFDAGKALYFQERPEVSVVGIVLTSLSLVVMRWLASAKRKAAKILGSNALAADAFQTTACWWLSLFTLVGISLNGMLGWWWADPLAALALVYFIVQEAREAWEGDDCCD